MWLVSIERSFQGLSVAVETMRIDEELTEIWPNEVCDTSQVQSAGSALYFMIIMDGFSSYWMVVFLKTKSAEITLKIIKGFHAEAEYQTGKRLKRVWLDMGREWYNNAWENYWAEQDLDFEFTTPYAVMPLENFLRKCSMGYTLYPWISLYESTLEISYKPQT